LTKRKEKIMGRMEFSQSFLSPPLQVGKEKLDQKKRKNNGADGI